MSENDLEKGMQARSVCWCKTTMAVDIPLFGFADGITCQFNAIALGTMPARSAYDAASNAAAIAG